jgi:hypothetical protein
MAGALAWRVAKKHNKRYVFFGARGRSHGSLPGVPPPVCASFSVFISILALDAYAFLSDERGS